MPHATPAPQAHPQSWRATSSTFNSILLVASVFFLACMSSAPQPGEATGDDAGGARADGSGAADGAAATLQRFLHGSDALQQRQQAGQRRQRRQRRGRRMLAPPPHRDHLETVEEVASSAERCSSLDTQSMNSSIRINDKDEYG